MSMARAMKSGAGSRIAAREAPRSAARVVRVLSHSRRGGNLPADERRASGRTEKAQAPRALEESLSELSYKVASLPDLQQAVSLPPLPDGTEGVNKVQLATSCIVLCIQVALLGLGRKGGEEVEDEGAPEYATELQEDIETLKSRVESLKSCVATSEQKAETAARGVESDLAAAREELAEAREQISVLEEAQAQLLRDQAHNVKEEVEYLEILRENYESVTEELREVKRRLAEFEKREEEEAQSSPALFSSPEAMRGKPPPPTLPVVRVEKEAPAAKKDPRQQ